MITPATYAALIRLDAAKAPLKITAERKTLIAAGYALAFSKMSGRGGFPSVDRSRCTITSKGIEAINAYRAAGLDVAPKVIKRDCSAGCGRIVQPGSPFARCDTCRAAK